MNIDSYITNLPDKELNNIAQEIINDFITSPMFYVPDSLKILNDLNFLINIKSKLNKYYSSGCGNSYTIPYDFISNREAICFSVDDLMIKYVLKYSIEKLTSFKLFTIEQNTVLISEFNNKANKDSEYVFKIDILDYYNSISHQIFIDLLSKKIELNPESDYCHLFNRSLEVVYKNTDNKVLKKEKGLTIGNKPDDFFADLFLKCIIDNIKIKNKIEIINVADEIFFTSKNLNQARTLFAMIEDDLSHYELKINKSKNTALDFNINVLLNKKKITLKTSDYLDGSSYYPSQTFQTIEITDAINYLNSEELTSKENNKKTIENITNSHFDEEDMEDEETEEEDLKGFHKKFLSNYKIKNYEDSIIFLKFLLNDKKSINQYQKKHPKYSEFYNLVFSQPKDFLIDFQSLDFCLFDKEILEKLLLVIYRYPRSEYYSALAIEILVFVAKNSIFCVDCKDDTYGLGYQGSYLEPLLTDICEFANIAIVEILNSEDIHEYQKSLVLRYLFKNEHNLDFSFKNYSIKIIAYSDYNNSIELPFLNNILKSIKSLNDKTNNFALKSICSHLLNLKNKTTSG